MAPMPAGASCCSLSQALAWILFPDIFKDGSSGPEATRSSGYRPSPACPSVGIHSKFYSLNWVPSAHTGALSLNGFIPASGGRLATSVTVCRQDLT